MTRICRIPRLGQALAVGWACCLAGCQQVPTNSAQPANRSLLNTPAADGPLTAAQQANMQIAMGRVTESQGDLTGAMAAYSEALKRDGKSAEAYVRMAILHDKQGEFRESAEMYRKALKLSPGNPDIYCDMGYSLYLQRRWAESEMNARQALALNAKHPRAHNNLALLLIQDGRLDDALAEFRKGGSDRASAHANVAFVLTMESRWADARKQYQLALEANPSSKELEARLRQLDTLVAKLEPGHDNQRGMQDARLVTTSSTIAQPVRRSAARVASPRDVPAPITTPSRSISQLEGTSAAPLLAVATPTVTSPGTGAEPVATAPRPWTIEGPKTAPGGGGDRARAAIPPPREFKAPKTVQTDSNPPASSRPIIPPPRIRVPRPDRPRTNEPADIPSLAPITINLPKADTTADRRQASEASPVLYLESAP